MHTTQIMPHVVDDAVLESRGEREVPWETADIN